MNKVIKIHGLNYQVAISGGGSVCGECAFYNGSCPEANGKVLCWAYGEDAYFAAEPSKPLVEEFKEAAGINTEKTYTRQQVWDAYFNFYGIPGEADKFCKFIDNMIDPEYQEYLRLKAKFE